ncbi:hypothetical protein DNL40_04665 [Xylanimonas oleitrophica]|uniref:DUF3817 domain-containing protein n=1 Tax=Xylanimonas oleitrophica TaxID=2607479 RepID=A0A2W5X253_9MICO|nr:hypothetical protein DNL40_04665 [Xylanimonas oleitrophica]
MAQTRPARGRTALRVLGAAELGSLLVLLGNLATVHSPAVSSAVGPLHGMLYLAVIVAALGVAGGRRGVWLSGLVPGVGGLLAERALRRSARRSATDA